MKGKGRLVTWLTAVLALSVAGTIPATAQVKRPVNTGMAKGPILPASANYLGMSYGEWSALWWQWVFSQPALDVGGTNTNPQFDSTGEFTLAGQEGNKVLFLPGAFGGPYTRNITIPTGYPLFFPVVNAWADVLGEDPVPDLAELYRRVESWTVGDPTALFLTLNGQSLAGPDDLAARRFQSPPFEYTIPYDNIFSYWGYDFHDQSVYPVVSDGYWIMLKPLPPGTYTLRFGVDPIKAGFELDITYNITVNPAGSLRRAD